jgi:hypothetical protein
MCLGYFAFNFPWLVEDLTYKKYNSFYDGGKSAFSVKRRLLSLFAFPCPQKERGLTVFLGA